MMNMMDKLFERLLAETDSNDATPVERAALSSTLARAETSSPAQSGDATERLASHFDGALNAEEAERFTVALAATPDDIYELEAAQAFLDEIAMQREAAPTDLVAAAVADNVQKTPRRVVRRSGFLGSVSWGRQFAWAGGAAATVLLGVIIVDRAGDIITDPTVAVVSTNAIDGESFSITSKEAPVSTVASLPPVRELRPVGLAQQNPPRANYQPRDVRNERDRAVPSGSVEQGLPKGVTVYDNLLASTPTPPPAATPAETVGGTGAANTPVRSLSPQGSAQTRAVTGADVFRTDRSANVTASFPPVAQAAPAAPLAYNMLGGRVSELNARVAPGFSPQNTERYPGARPNAVKVVADEPVSTFSLDVDTASYANVRRYLTQGTLPPADAVRVEEMVNYFDYAYMVPRDRNVPFLPSVAVYPSPWNPDTQILHVGIKGYDLPRSERPKTNLVFLIDTSGSMNEPAKLPLVKRSFQLLVEQLKEDDHVSIVVYAGSAGMVLPPTPGWDKDRILASLDRLQAGGSTAGGEGIRQAYELAKANFDRSGVNRVILATDGDFNVGITDPNALEAFVARERASGVFLSVLGYGGGNYNDLLMQKLAQAGNGTAAYIDTLSEARKVFVDEMSSTLFTIAKDVKVQIEFNPERVAEYRLIGYETRMLNQTDFNNDRVDAGDVGSGHTVTALYEITPVGSRAQMTDPLRYGTRRDVRPAQSELAFVKIRYKLPDEDESKLITRPVENRDIVSDFGRLPIDYRFAAAVAGSAQLLRNDPYIKSFDFERAIEIAQAARGDDEFGYRNEFIQLLRRASAMAPRTSAASADAAVTYVAPNPPRPLTSHAVTADDYPPESVRLQEQGTVKVRYLVGVNGQVGRCEVAVSSGTPRLDDAACNMVTQRWRFTPATLLGGGPIAVWQEANIAFALR
jgi:Ca-activated chloride channel family protein